MHTTDVENGGFALGKCASDGDLQYDGNKDIWRTNSSSRILPVLYRVSRDNNVHSVNWKFENDPTNYRIR